MPSPQQVFTMFFYNHGDASEFARAEAIVVCEFDWL
jgi:hypothetical protein